VSPAKKPKLEPSEVSPAKKPKLEPSGGSGDHINTEENCKGIYLFILFNRSTLNYNNYYKNQVFT